MSNFDIIERLYVHYTVSLSQCQSHVVWTVSVFSKVHLSMKPSFLTAAETLHHNCLSLHLVLS